jgi:hypothetical protein
MHGLPDCAATLFRLMNMWLGLLARCCIGFCMTEWLCSCLVGVSMALASVPPLFQPSAISRSVREPVM